MSRLLVRSSRTDSSVLIFGKPRRRWKPPISTVSRLVRGSLLSPGRVGGREESRGNLLDTTRHPLAVLKALCERKRALVRAGRTRRSTPAVYALLFSSAVPQEIFGKVLSYVYFGPSSTTPPRPWDPSRDERGDTEYWRIYLALEGLPVPDDLNDVPFGDPKELPGWVEDESTSDY